MPEDDLLRNLRDLPPAAEPQPFELLLAELVKINAGISDLKERLNVGNELRIEQNEQLKDLLSKQKSSYKPVRRLKPYQSGGFEWN